MACLLACWLAAAAPLAVAAAGIGNTEFAQGEVTAQQPDEDIRKLRRASRVLNKDLLETGRESYAILEFDNHSRIAMRERTRAQLVQEPSESGQTNRIKLIRGGLRGTASQKDPYDLMVIDSPAGVIIVDEGEVSTRWCDADCGATAQASVQGVAKVQLASSPVSALRDLGAGKGKGRILAPGDLIFERERIETGAGGETLLVFRDDMRLTLAEDSRVDINTYQFFPEDPAQNEVHIHLRQGRVRLKSGSVGQNTPDRFLVETPVNRVRVRGTGFDLHCVGSCINSPDNPIAGTNEQSASGLYINVWDGAIDQVSEAGTFPLAAGQSSYVMNSRSAPIRLPRLPPRIIKNQPPRPDSVVVSADTLFDLNSSSGGLPGLYVHVHSGKARVETQSGRVMEVNTGRTGYMDPRGNAPTTSGSMPGFMATEGSCN